MARLETLLEDNNFTQLVDVSTHRHGHILDWVVVRDESSRLSFTGVLNYPDMSDHGAVVCSLDVAAPPVPTRIVSSRNIRAISLPDFRSAVRDVTDPVEAGSCPLPEAVRLVDVYNQGLRDVLDRHAPTVTRRVRDRPSAPWLSDEVRGGTARAAAERATLESDRTHHSQAAVRQRAGKSKGHCSIGKAAILCSQDRGQSLRPLLCG